MAVLSSKKAFGAGVAGADSRSFGDDSGIYWVVREQTRPRILAKEWPPFLARMEPSQVTMTTNR